MSFTFFTKPSTGFEIVPQDDIEDVRHDEKKSSFTWHRSSKYPCSHLTVSRVTRVATWAITILLVLSNLHFMWLIRRYSSVVQAHKAWPQHPVYSPAQNAVQYHDIVYTSGFGAELSEYQGPPSPESDQAWSDLYILDVEADFEDAVGISRISMAEAHELANRTVPIPDDPGYYAVGLDVFSSAPLP
ncbi:uncharacterized protein Z518_11299 [Rhinocladiella mackenziei CBS 650.93]|uniref:Uncharacterized protein n=1 Tax=Rhinocladiella mackenziei CBS 650.93 TaxID=1442369 RepID=A0A0D2I8M3_9EURO|nr:uncharacterized protein Z518_11299 [Rhinocladiella mackenziei CBS 650.93]KIW99560.1 hypothetical protein Z518_11299 [Rhinocladiella mackenziei CBS 650.93]